MLLSLLFHSSSAVELALLQLAARALDSWLCAVTKSAVTPVKDQGQRGSWWAFSSTGVFEDSWELSTGSLVSLSELQLVDCSKQNSGCNGGLMDSAYAFYKNIAIAAESSYPYTARDGTCFPKTRRWLGELRGEPR